jgi:hypothetical protein
MKAGSGGRKLFWNFGVLRAPLAGLVLAAGVGAGSAFGFTVTNTQSLNSGTTTLTGSGGESIVPQPGPVYNWADTNGDAVAGDYASSDLVLGANTLYTDNGTNITLRLRNAAGKGQITGASGAANLATIQSGKISGSIAIYDVGDLNMGGIDTCCNYPGGNGPASGNLNIGQSTNLAGNIRVDFIRTGGGSDPRAFGGAVTIYGLSNVLVQTSGEAAGDLFTYSSGYNSGQIAILHDGAFRVNQIYADAGAGYAPSGQAMSILLDGDVLANGPSGACQILGSISNSYTRADGFGASNGGITIRNYTSVSVAGNVFSYNNSTSGGRNGGNILITNIAGNIEVGGQINASSVVSTPGILALSAGGTITLASLDLGTLKSAMLMAGRDVYISGSLLNFPTASPADGLLDAPAGSTIHYRTHAPGNAYLAGNTYFLKSGGKLRSEARGTVVTFK